MKRNKNLRELARRYLASLRKYLAHEKEASLEEAYELGRSAIASELGILDVARLHLQAREKVLQSEASGKNRARISKLSGVFFLQALSPFEATHRGFRETNTELLKRNEELAAEIRERQRTEKALRASEYRYSTLIETAQDMIFSLAQDGRIVELNRAFEVVTGWLRTDWLGKPFTMLIHPAEASVALERFHKVLQGKQPEVWEYRVRAADGQHIIGEFTLAREIQGGKTVGVFGIGRDITARKRVEDVLRTSEERLRAILDHSPAVIFLKDKNGCYLHVNRQFERQFRLDRSQVVGRKDLEIFLPQQAAFLLRHDQDVLRDGMPLEFEETAGYQDGNHTSIISKFPLRDAKGRIYALCGIATDITTRKQAEEALRGFSWKILHAQEEERRRISRELHDEVGQSLTAISVTLASLRNNGAAKSASISRQVALTQRLLEGTMEAVHRFARELRPAMLDELGLLPALRSHMKNFSSRTGLRVRFSAVPEAEQLDGERKTALFRIAQESLTNVAKHARASRVNVSIQETGDGVCMEIADNGRSFRANPETFGKQKQRLGLLGMQERVRLVNGRFSIKPMPGRGTTVRVTIPFQSLAAGDDILTRKE